MPQGLVRSGPGVLIVVLLAFGCATPKRPSPTSVDNSSIISMCQAIWLAELGRTIDPSGLASCIARAQAGGTKDTITADVRTSPEYRRYQEQLRKAEERLSLETGWLHLSADKHIVNEAGTKWRGLGVSDFLLFQRYVRGEDLTVVLEQRRDLGFGYLRVFGMFDGSLGRFHVDETPEYFTRLGAFLELVASYGLRIEFVVFADAQRAMPTGQALHLWAVASVLDRHWNALGELANEYAQNGIDPRLFNKPAGRTLWSRGSNCCGDDGYIDPPWDYITHHAARDAQWPRKSECRPIRDASGRDCLEDEPMGASPTDQPGRRSNSPTDFAQAGLNFGLNASGGTFHSDSGILSVPFGDVEIALARAFLLGLTYAPVAAMLAPYQRGDNCGSCPAIGAMPLAQTDLPDPKGTLRTFCRRVANTEYCVAIRPGPAWTPVTQDGWTVTEQPMPGLLKLDR